MSRPRPRCVHSRLVYGAEGVCFAYLCTLTGSTWQTHSPLQSNPQPANWHKQFRKAEATHNSYKQAEKQAG